MWGWFLELNGSGQLSFQEIESWSKLTCREVNSAEVLILRRLDNIYQEVINGQRDSQSNDQSRQRRGRHR